MKEGTKLKRWIFVLAGVLICLTPLLGVADTRETFLPAIAILEEAAKEGLLYPLEPLGEQIDVVVDSTVYGYAVRRFQTWFEVGDIKLWSSLGVEPPSGILSWDEWVSLADAVAAYNQRSSEPIWLLAVQEQRFPRTCALMEKQEIRMQWEKMQPIICAFAEESERVLLTERVLTLNQIGYHDYVIGFEHDEQVYRLAEIETRYATILKDMNDPEALKDKLISEVQKESFAVTGILPVDLSYEECREAWNLNLTMPSELNFNFWKQMEEDKVQ